MMSRKSRHTEAFDRRSRLSFRIPLFALLFSAVIALCGSAIQLLIEYDKESELVHMRIKEIELGAASVLADSIWELDREKISLELGSMLLVPGIRYLKVESSDLGDIVAGEPPASNIVKQKYPLMYEGEGARIQVGNLYIEATLDGVYERIKSRALLIMSIEAIKTFLVATFILLLIHFLVTRHVTSMASYMRDLNISELEDPLSIGLRRNYHREDELDELVTAINSMRLSLGQAHFALQKSHSTLEQKVEERTRELVAAKDDAEKASQAKSEFLATINHELRTPLTSILGGLGLLTHGTMGDIPEKISAPLDIAYRNSQRLLLLVNDMLDIAKIDAGHIFLDCKEVEVKAFLEHAIALNQAYAELFDVNLSLVSCADGLVMYADEHRLHQVMNNLISNAIKFTHVNDVIEVSAKQVGSEIEICVTDHGVGIPKEFSEKIFEKFTQVDGSDSRSAGGTGLGLSISKSIVEMHGGSLRFDSTPLSGASFYITVKQGSDSDFG